MRGKYKRTPKIREKMRIAQLNYLKNHPPQIKGKKMSLEVRDKMSKAMIKRLDKLKEEGKPHFLAGRKLSEERKTQQSKTMKGRYAGSKHPLWKGGRKTSFGYVFLKQPHHPQANKNGYIQEHRLVAEKVLNRFLKPKEVVHHINGDPTDNRPENLIVFKNSASHTKFHNGEEIEKSIIFDGRTFAHQHEASSMRKI